MHQHFSNATVTNKLCNLDKQSQRTQQNPEISLHIYEKKWHYNQSEMDYLVNDAEKTHTK